MQGNVVPSGEGSALPVSVCKSQERTNLHLLSEKETSLGCQRLMVHHHNVRSWASMQCTSPKNAGPSTVLMAKDTFRL